MTSGVAAGVVLLCSLRVIGNSGPLPWKDWGNLTVSGVGMFGAGLLACTMPTVRTLRVQPHGGATGGGVTVVGPPASRSGARPDGPRDVALRH